MENKEQSPIEELKQKLEEKHTLLLDEYSKGNSNNEVMQMYRSRMKDVLEVINSLGNIESTYKKQIDVLDGRVNHWRKIYKEELEKIEELQSQLAEKDKEIEAITTKSNWQTENNGKLHSDIENLQSQLAEKDKEIEGLHSSLLDVAAKAVYLQSELTELKEKHKYDENDMLQAAKYGYVFRDTTSFPEHKFEDSCINNTKQWLIYYKETHKTK